MNLKDVPITFLSFVKLIKGGVKISYRLRVIFHLQSFLLNLLADYGILDLRSVVVEI